MEEEMNSESSIFVVRTTGGQEKNAAELIEARVKAIQLPLLSILVPEDLRGYIFIEAESLRGPHIINEAIAGVKHVKAGATSRMLGRVQFSEIEKYLVTKPIIQELEVGYLVEITGGPFRGMQARITRINRVKSEATLELLEAAFTLPITVNADYLKLIDRTSREV